MTNPSPRPEAIADLPSMSTKPVFLAEIQLDGYAVGSGLLRAADEFIAFYKVLFQDELVISTSGDRVELGRARSEAELAEELEKKQAEWDKANAEKIAAEKRDQLTVGDKLDVGKPTLVCQMYSSVPCSLEWQHRGKHIKVKNGVVAEITENTRG